MKFHILLNKFTNEAKVTNESETDFKGYLGNDLKVIAPKAIFETTIPIAQLIFGNWEKENDYYEIQRRKALNISHFEVVLDEIVEEPKKRGKKGQVLNTKTEIEFEDLDLLNKSDEKIEEVDEKCKATTKKGVPCKANALDNGYCLAHQKLSKGE